jgi:predicted RNase H-related nuclease YkuK (DUF458 family)
MISKIDEVINALRADTVLTGLLKGQYVYWQKPSASPASYITVFEISNGESDSADDEEYADDIEIQVDIWTKGSTIPIALQVQKTMRAMGYTHQAMPDDYDKSTGIYHKPIRFFIKVEV